MVQLIPGLETCQGPPDVTKLQGLETPYWREANTLKFERMEMEHESTIPPSGPFLLVSPTFLIEGLHAVSIVLAKHLNETSRN